MGNISSSAMAMPATLVLITPLSETRFLASLRRSPSVLAVWLLGSFRGVTL